jgi:hypothetical protein
MDVDDESADSAQNVHSAASSSFSSSSSSSSSVPPPPPEEKYQDDLMLPAPPPGASQPAESSFVFVRMLVSVGNHQGSARSMEAEGFERNLRYLAALIEKVKTQPDCPRGIHDLRIQICVDGDTQLAKLLDNHPLISIVYRDLAHLSKNIYHSVHDTHAVC